jgi:hypothetical protein
MATPASIASQANAAKNLEAVNSEYKMRQNPEAYRQMIMAKVTKIQEEAKNQKRNAFAKQFNELGRHFDMEQNAMNYANRNDDIAKMNEMNLNQITGSLDSIKYNKDLSRRQAEINDWYYQDKLETLFFLQLFFMTMLSMSIVFYFQKSGLVSTAFAGFLTFVLLIIVAIAGVYRYTYTSEFRDPRWWYKRRFAKPIYTEEKKCGCEDDPFVEPKVRCPAKDDPKADCLSGLSGATPMGQIIQARGGNVGLTALAGVLAKDQQVLNGSPADSLDRAQSQLEAETVAYMQGANPPPEKKEPACRGKTACEAIHGIGSSKCTEDVTGTEWFGFKSKTVTGEPGSTNMALNQNVLPYL